MKASEYQNIESIPKDLNSDSNTKYINIISFIQFNQLQF